MQELLKNCLQYARIMQELLTVCKNCLQYARIAYSMQELLTVCKTFSFSTGSIEGLGMRLTAVSVHEDILLHNGTLLLQAKSYVHVLRRAGDNDRGYVSISYSRYATRLHVEDRKDHYCRIALLCAFAFLNILTPIALAKSLSWYYPRVRAVASGRHSTACLYWAAALITFL